jgi:predicted  nucleic acid-binding Zn-ribbon protein
MNPLPIWQLLTVVVIPFMGILLGILLNQRAADKLSGEIKDVRGEFKDIRGELKDVRGEIKDIRGEIKDIRVELRDFRKQMHEEYFGLINMIGDHGQRIVRIEERGTR